MIVNDCSKVVFNGVEHDRVVFNDVTIWDKPDDTVLYSVGILSDTHIQEQNYSPVYAHADFANAISFLRDYGCRMTCVCGDLTEEGTREHFANYVAIRDTNRGGMSVFSVVGNHEAAQSRVHTSIITEETCIAHHIYEQIGDHYCYYVKNGQLTYWDLSPENYSVETAPNVTVPDPSIVLPESDVYIFIGILGERNQHLFWDEFFPWFEQVLEEHKHKRCFIFEHCRAEKLIWDSETSAYVGDAYADYVSGNAGGHYLKSLWGAASDGGWPLQWETLLSRYTNCIWFHGHSHLEAEACVLSPVANADAHFGDKYDPKNPASSLDNTRWSWSVHIPSCARPFDVTEDGREAVPGRSQGAIMDVYRNKVVIKYFDFGVLADDGTTTYVNTEVENARLTLDTARDLIETEVTT